MKKIFNKELIIGSCVIITLAILFFGIDYLKGINIFKAANYYYVSYTNVAGLAQSAPVTVNGYKVGLVRDIQYEYDNPGHVKVELSLDKQLKVPTGSKAILTTDMLGTSTIVLEMSDNTGFHEVGDRLIGVNSTGLMDNLTGEVLPQVIDVIPKVDSLLVSVTKLVNDPAIASSLVRLDKIMANVEKATGSLATTMGTVEPASRQLPSVINNIDKLSASLATASADLAQVAANIKKMPIDSTVKNINAITDNLAQVTQALNSKDSSLGLLLYDPNLYYNINNTAAHLDSIMIDLKRQPKRYIPSIKIF